MSLKLIGLTATLAAFIISVAPDIAGAESDKPLKTATNARVSVSTKGEAEQRFTAYITGYGYWDNTPPGSVAISKPVIHSGAGGTGTFKDPVTIAVGHTINGSRQTLDYAPGTRFYIERLRKYAIVEDVCGDGNNPQGGPCHTGYQGHPWLDVYIGGGSKTASATTACARQITALQKIIINPKPDYPVHAGEITGTGCQVF
ncbi:MAG: hypothetical protein WCC57_07665 [Paracoccaceae bacterium]